MSDTKQGNPNIKKSNQRWQSDLIVDLIKQYGFPYIALNPGASFRGLHDSLVNYGENQPPMLLCNHEKIAVQIAHGYAKASGKPMMAIVHDVVGLLHAPMGIYYAYIDRCPVFIVGATGPMDEKYRRPFIDWIHTAFAQGDAARMPIGFESTVKLAETVGAAVFDINKRLGFPNRHPLSVSFPPDAFKGVDLVAALDVVDWTRGSHKLNTQTREITVVTTPDCKWIDVGFADIEISKWATDYNKHHNWNLRVLGDSTITIPALAAACRKRIDGNKALAARIE